MSFRIVLPAAALMAALAPALSYASPESEALSACTRAFESSVAASGVITPVFRLKYRSEPTSPWGRFYNRKYTFYLQARDLQTGQPRASATCSTSKDGNLIALEATPVDAALPALASAKF